MTQKKPVTRFGNHMETIAKELSISDKTVRRAVKDLEKAGLVRKEYKKRKNGSFTSNRYYLT